LNVQTLEDDRNQKLTSIPTVLSKIEGIDDDTHSKVLKHIIHTEDILSKKEHAICHGDYGPQQVIFGTSSAYIVDWETITYTVPLYDIGWFSWITYLHFEPQTSAQEALNAFKNGYIKVLPW